MTLLSFKALKVRIKELLKKNCNFIEIPKIKPPEYQNILFHCPQLELDNKNFCTNFFK